MIVALALAALSCPPLDGEGRPSPPNLTLEEAWTAPAELPIARVNAWIRHRDEQWMGGLGGLYRGKPGNWAKIDDRPVKEIAESGEALWVLFGDGSVDKLEPRSDRLFYDVLKEASKRPWAACIGLSGDGLRFGGLGGWIDRGRKPSESFPKAMEGDVVTVALGDYLGTQKHGLFRWRNGKLDRYGFAAGVADSWITSLAKLPSKDEVVVGLADGGVVTGVDRFRPLNQPSQKVRKLAVYAGRLVVGGMEGCFIQSGSDWQRLTDQETTCVAVDGKRLGVGTPTGLSWWVPGR